MHKLTKSTMNALKPGPKTQTFWDNGLGVRVTPAGAKTYVVKYALGSGRGARARIASLGATNQMGLEQARQLAGEWRRDGKAGIDRANLQREEAAEPTMRELAEAFIGAKRRKGLKTLPEIERIMTKDILPTFGSMRVKDVAHRDVVGLHTRFAAEGHATKANRSIAWLSSLFTFAMREGHRTDNPAQLVEREPEAKGERYLTAAERADLEAAFPGYVGSRPAAYRAEAEDAVNAIRLLLRTGCRPSELLNAKWADIDFEAKVWHKPDTKTGAKEVYLSTGSIDQLKALLKRQQRGKVLSLYVIPGRSVGRPRKSLRGAWEDIRELAGLKPTVLSDGTVKPVRLYDLRHTAASVLLEAGVPLDMVGKMLGHTQTQTTSRYAHLTDTAGAEVAKRLDEALR